MGKLGIYILSELGIIVQAELCTYTDLLWPNLSVLVISRVFEMAKRGYRKRKTLNFVRKIYREQFVSISCPS